MPDQMPAPPVSQDELAKEMEAKFDKAEKACRNAHQRMYKNLAFLVGKQYVQQDRMNHNLIMPMPSKKVRVVFNRIFPIIRVQLAKLSKMKPILTASANTNEPQDIASAKIAGKLFNWAWQHQLMDKDLMTLLSWLLPCGCAYAQPYWNPRKGTEFEEFDYTNEPTPLPAMSDIQPLDPNSPPPQRTDMAGTPLFHVPDEMGQPSKKKYWTGEIENRIYSPFEVFPDHISDGDLRECRYVFTQSTKSVEWVYDMYGVDVKGEQVKQSGLEAQLLGLFGNVSQDIEDAVTVKEYWERPSKKYPKGRWMVKCNDQVIEMKDPTTGQVNYDIPEEYQDPNDWCPLIKFDATPLPPGKFYKTSVIELLEPIQKQFNVEHSMLIKHLAQGSKILIPTGSDITEEQWTETDGERINFTPVGGMQPTVTTPPGRGSDIWRHLDKVEKEFDNESGVHEVSRAMTPSGVTSGIAIDYLQEQDDTQLGPTVHLFGISLARWGKKELRLMQVKYDEERTIKIVGTNNDSEVLKFKGADINLDCDLKVEMTSSLPRSKTARDQFIMQMADKQWITPKQAMKMLEVPETEDVWRQELLDEAQARWENDDMSKGVVHIPVSWQNHQMHLQTHNEIRKKPEYYTIDKRVQDIFENHCKVHSEIIKMAVQEAMQTQAAMTQKPAQGGVNVK
jgi:hypothetical protein